MRSSVLGVVTGLRAPFLLATIIATIACSDAPGAQLPVSHDIETADQLFSLEQLAEVRIELLPGSREMLRTEPREYVPARIRIAGKILEPVAVRLKGTFSFQALDGKAAFKIKFNHYQENLEALGLEGITLNNLTQDHTAVREWLTYSLFRAAGASAPRSGYAVVHVDGNLYGLYALIESVDDSFLAARFQDPSGSVYEGDFGDDLVPEDLLEFDQDEGADESRADLAALIDAVQDTERDLFFGQDSPLDTRTFLAFVASEAMTGHWDGYWKSHNYRIYQEPTLDKWYFIPWGADQSLREDIKPFASKGHLAQLCFGNARCLAEYVRVAREVVDAFEGLDMPMLMEDAAALTQSALEADPRQPFELEAVERHRDILRDFLVARPQLMRERLDCIDASGAQLDRDSDGYLACFADCNDTSALARPGGVETCDGIDNDCDGFVDELTTCRCDEEILVGTARFALCEDALRWSTARDRCRALGGELATIESEAENQAIYAATQARRAGRWYLGLSDGDEEGVFAWPVGDQVGYTAWVTGEPDDWGEEDCVGFELHGDGGWADFNCAAAHPFVCRL